MLGGARAQVRGDRSVELDELEPKVRPQHSPVSLQLRDDPLDLVDRHGEGDPIHAHCFHRVHADDLAREVEQRPARVARVDRRVGLDVLHRVASAQGLPQPYLRARPLYRRHDSRRDGVGEAERRSQRHDELARPKVCRRAERDRRQRRLRPDSNNRDVGRRVGVLHHTAQFSDAVREGHHHLPAAARHDVGVGEHDAGRVDDEARARCAWLKDGATADADVHQGRACLCGSIRDEGGLQVWARELVRRAGGGKV
mmetsp:Transcript_16081/g.27408  ORF Transcript_16081/g.27408 Transcript_16081/m.27408 type:complete len:255 (-) Transcript_16081:166-930(-)